MVTFKLITSQFPANNIKTENAILKELRTNIDFYDDYDHENDENNFMEAFNLIDNEFSLVETNKFVINGYNLEWKDYKYYINNIFPEIFDVINDLRNNNSTKLIFYGTEEQRIIHFYPNMNTISKNTIYSNCTSLKDGKTLGISETIEKYCLLDQLTEIIYNFAFFAKLNYPLVYHSFLLPYLTSKRSNCIFHPVGQKYKNSNQAVWIPFSAK